MVDMNVPSPTCAGTAAVIIKELGYPRAYPQDWEKVLFFPFVYQHNFGLTPASVNNYLNTMLKVLNNDVIMVIASFFSPIAEKVTTDGEVGKVEEKQNGETEKGFIHKVLKAKKRDTMREEIHVYLQSWANVDYR